MNIVQAVTLLAALAHPQRLEIFRLLMREWPNGLAASELAEAVGASPNAASFHFRELDRAGVIRSRRDGRYVRYTIHVKGVRKLLTYLAEDCCQGRPELCGKGIKKVKVSRRSR